MREEKIRDVMTKSPQCLPEGASVIEAARMMEEHDIGTILVTKNDEMAGVVTDRDIVVRGLTCDRAPGEVKLGDICSREVTCLSPDDDVDDAIEIMRGQAVRRIPVVDGKRVVGVVSLGDLAIARDRDSVLGAISSAPPNT